MTPIERAAHEYLSAGLSVIALVGKMPNTFYHPRGLNSALSGIPTKEDEHTLDLVFNNDVTTGIGIVLPDHLVVVDIDGEEGAAALAEILGTTDLPLTGVASTGRGLHLYYATTKVYRTMKLGEKLDLKGVGGYVAAPPSLHPSGATYKWLEPLVQDGAVHIDWLPDAIVQSVARRELMQNTPVRVSPPRQQARLVDGKWTMVDVPRDLSGLIDAVASAQSGDRNNLLNWAAYRAKEDGVPYETTLSELGTAAAEAGLDAREIRTTIRSAYRARA